jgi:hypothetical protein
VTAPPFAESVSEGDVRWEKGKRICYFDTVIIITAGRNKVCWKAKKEMVGQC